MGMKTIKRKATVGVTRVVPATHVVPATRDAVSAAPNPATPGPALTIAPPSIKAVVPSQPPPPGALVSKPPSSVFEHMAITRRQLSNQQLAMSRVKDALEVVERQRHEEMVEKSSTEAVEAVMGTLLRRKGRRDQWMEAAFNEGKYNALAALSGDERKDIQFASELAGLNRLVKRDERDGDDDSNGKSGVTNVVMVRLDGMNGNVNANSITTKQRNGKTTEHVIYKGTKDTEDVKGVSSNARPLIEAAYEDVTVDVDDENEVEEPGVEVDATIAGPVFRRFALDVESSEAVVASSTGSPLNSSGVGRVERVRDDDD